MPCFNGHKKTFFSSLISSFLSSSTPPHHFNFSQYTYFFCWYPLQRMSLCIVRWGERQVGDFRSGGLRQNWATELSSRSQSWLCCPLLLLPILSPSFQNKRYSLLNFFQAGSSPQCHSSCLGWGVDNSLFSFSTAHGPSCVAPFMNMHEIRYDIALLPLIILSSDLCSRKLQSVASQSKCSLKTNKTQQNKTETPYLFVYLFFQLTGIKHSNIWARVCEGAEEGWEGAGGAEQGREKSAPVWMAGLVGSPERWV